MENGPVELSSERHEAMKVLPTISVFCSAYGAQYLSPCGWLPHLYTEVLPSLGIVFHEGIVRTFLRDDEKGAYVGIGRPR